MGVIKSSGGGKIYIIGRRMNNRPRKTSEDQWLGTRRKRKSLGMAIIKSANHYVHKTAQQEHVASLGKQCGAELKGKLKGKDWATIKKAMAACVLIKQGKPVPDDWRKVYESLKG